MRLIDADKLHDKLNKMFPDTLSKDAENVFISVMISLEEQPTEYDAEKVVEQIRKLKDFDPDGNINTYSKLIDEDEVVDIVRKGGIE